MKKIAMLALLVLSCAAGMLPGSLYDQSIAEVLRKQFTSPALSYVVIDAPTGTRVAARWEDLDRPVPTGSMVKPFTALAYAQSHGFEYPLITCRGTADGCWLPRGHGRVGITDAIGNSCNAYFRKLAARVSPQAVQQVTFRYGIGRRFEPLSPAALAGLGGGLEIPPERIVRAYLELSGQSGEPGVAEVLRGMALSARAGTARAIQEFLPGAPVLAKTGTTPCVHAPRGPGDGYTIILFPADSPRFALLVRLHGVPGARAAMVGGEMLRTIVTGK
jgi:cell division protein FtsI/penicillin-binding protein 2